MSAARSDGKLRARLITGTLLALGGALALGVDCWLGPIYPVLVLLVLGLAIGASRELVRLFEPEFQPNAVVVTLGTTLVLLANWFTPWSVTHAQSPLLPMFVALVGVFLGLIGYEMARFRGPDHTTGRLANTVFAVAYLGILPGFLVQLRFWNGGQNPVLASTLMAVVIFVPKCADIGAYFTGRLVGRTQFSRWLSPKKTVEGVVGGLVFGTLPAILLQVQFHLFPAGYPEAMLFGVVVGAAGVLGDLAESMLKRDRLVKDAATTLPGFGGILDVLDSVFFAAPVAYFWFSLRVLNPV